MPAHRRADHRTVWLFDLDNTLHDAGSQVFGALNTAMRDYVQRHLRVDADEARRLNLHYWRRYGATLLGLQRHHGVQAAHFLAETHRLPGLEGWLRSHPHDVAALAQLPGRRVLLTNAPRAYAERVLKALGIARLFDAVLAIEDMAMFGRLRPKPDARMLRGLCVRLGVPPSRCVLVEDTLQHQKAAHRVGMRTVWMLRWARQAPHGGMPARGLQPCLRAPWVGQRVHSLRELLR